MEDMMHHLSEYRKTEVNTADKIRLVIMLYDGAVNFLRIAKNKLHQRDIAGKGLYLAKTTAIVGELSSALDMEAGGEIAKNLRSLYTYILGRLLDANLKNDYAAFDEVERILLTLSEGWKGIEIKNIPLEAGRLTVRNETESLAIRV
jgi:flagellar protein FliS